MLRKTTFGLVDFNIVKRDYGYDSCEKWPDMTLFEFEKKLDELMLKKAALESISDEYEFDKEYKAFLEEQHDVIEYINPVLARLVDLGAFLLEVRGEAQSGDGEDARFLNAWSDYGYQIVRGYTIGSSRIDMVTDPPPVDKGLPQDVFLE